MPRRESALLVHAVRRCVAIVSLLLAWFCANGALWDVVQVFAWTRMFTQYAAALPVGEALQETFDASKPCPICCAVAKARNAERSQTPTAVEHAPLKLVLAGETTGELVATPPLRRWETTPPQIGMTRTDRVPVPPPRA